ncbi:MAG TPA: DUF4367 domain-containing protein [Bacilli bacterium]
MKKILILLILMILMVGCNKADSVEVEFMENLSESKSYKVEGMMETFYDNDRKQNDFVVYYKQPDFLKVTIKSVENNDQQIILKNQDGVYVLVPSVNKNFKIQSSWPANASYPYLLQSLAKDIANEDNIVRTETDTTVEIETDTKMHTDANVVKQKIIFNKSTALPTEVKVYDADGELYIRCVFNSIELDYNLSATEFDVEDSLSYARLEYGEDGLVFENRSLKLPTYLPKNTTLNSQSVSSTRAVMKFSGGYGFTIIQELVDDSEKVSSVEEEGNIIMVFGTTGVLTEHYLKFVYEGIEYTLASSEIKLDELLKVASSYMLNEEK